VKTAKHSIDRTGRRVERDVLDVKYEAIFADATFEVVFPRKQASITHVTQRYSSKEYDEDRREVKSKDYAGESSEKSFADGGENAKLTLC
jgi:hypothetical protein